MKKNIHGRFTERLRGARFLVSLLTFSSILLTLHIASPFFGDTILIPTAKANSVYFNMASGNLNFSVTPASVNQITTNDDWSAVNSVEGYFGQNITATHGVNPQTVLNTEFVNNQLPNTPRNVAANKGNPSAFNAGGLAEFDGGTYLAIGFQGNVQANPYMVFYLNTTGRASIVISYSVQDIDAGSNDAVSPVALQYRVGETGLFTNLPSGYIADATDGGVAGRITNKSVTLPSAAINQPKVQVRVITTNAANAVGGSTPDEWVGVNNFVLSSSPFASAANVNIAGRVMSPSGRGVSRASVEMSSIDGSTRHALTNDFGYFHYSEVEVGQTYIFTVTSKTNAFSPRTIRLVDELSDLNFTADQ